MRRIRSFRPSPAVVIACLALLVAAAGTSFAAVPNGPSALAPDIGDTYSTYRDEAVQVSGTDKVLAHLAIPQKGNYSILGKAYLAKMLLPKEPLGIVHCTLTAGSSDDETIVALENQEFGVLMLHVVTPLTASTTAKLKCRALASYLTAKFTKITATRVRSLAITPS